MEITVTLYLHKEIASLTAAGLVEFSQDIQDQVPDKMILIRQSDFEMLEELLDLYQVLLVRFPDGADWRNAGRHDFLS